MCWEGFQDVENIGSDTPDVAGDVDVRELNQGMIQKNQGERQEKLGITERMDSTKDGGKENNHRETKSQTDCFE